MYLCVPINAYESLVLSTSVAPETLGMGHVPLHFGHGGAQKGHNLKHVTTHQGVCGFLSSTQS